MPDLKRPVTVAGSGRVKLPIERLVPVGRAAPLAFQDAFKDRTLSHGQTKCDIAGRDDSWIVTPIFRLG